MSSIGESLRRERLRRNLQLEAVSKDLKISARMLAAIEAEDFQKLPGGVFVKAFVRQYAQFLGLDGDEMAGEVDRMFRPQVPPEAPRPDVGAVPLPRMEAWQSVSDDPGWRRGWSAPLPALMMVVVVMLVCSAVYAFLQRPKQVAATNPKHAVQAHTQPAPQPPPNTAPQSQAAIEPPKQPAEAPASPTAASTNEAAQAGAPAAAAPAPTGVAAAPPTAPGPVHVEITALEPVWLRAASDGKYTFSGTLDANQTRTVDANESVLLRLGNAGGVAVKLNGKPIGELGPKGQVRNIQLTSGGFQIVAAPKSPPVEPL